MIYLDEGKKSKAAIHKRHLSESLELEEPPNHAKSVKSKEQHPLAS